MQRGRGIGEIRIIAGLIGGLALSAVHLPFAAAATPVPAHTGFVVDQAGVLSPSVREELEASLRDYQTQSGGQLQLLTIPTLGGEAIEAYSIRVADTWKVGAAGKDNGVILLVAAQDHQLRIEVGKGLEGEIPDAIAGRIIRDVITPYFKQGDYDSGIVAGLSEIAHLSGGELRTRAVAAPTSSPVGMRTGRSAGIGLFPILILIFFVFSFFRRRRSRSGLLSGMLLGGLLGGGRGGGGGSDSGFFGGGGGGGFNGGGSSGRW